MATGVHLPRRVFKCFTCETTINAIGSRDTQKYCSRSCQYIARKLKPLKVKNCLCCQIEFVPRKKNIKYCTKQCAGKHGSEIQKQSGFYQSYKAAKRILLKDSVGCSKCGWNQEPAILELHHIDRDRKNNHLSNLTILCPNCHSLDHFLKKDGQFLSNLGKINKNKY
jgi:5-methylcytosine-specific restriction endonuclease McrA